MTRNLDKARLAACREHLRGGSRSFFAASHLLPARYAEPATVLYAFCRIADDLIDLDPGNGDEALERLRAMLDRCYADSPGDCVVERAFTELVRGYDIPRALPEALLEGFRWDIDERRYDDIDALCAYATRVAGTVGCMMALVMDTRDPNALARAADLGIAMQLTNIARDVGEDARAGRLYLPTDWFAEAGLDAEDWLEAPAHSRALGAIVERLLSAADAYYARAETGIGLLPAPCRPGIWAARLLYAEIGHALRAAGHDSVARRTVVGARRKTVLLGHAVVRSAMPRQPDPAPAAMPARYLVDAVAATLPASVSRPAADEGRWAEVLEIFIRLEQRDRLPRDHADYADGLLSANTGRTGS